MREVLEILSWSVIGLAVLGMLAVATAWMFGWYFVGIVFAVAASIVVIAGAGWLWDVIPLSGGAKFLLFFGPLIILCAWSIGRVISGETDWSGNERYRKSNNRLASEGFGHKASINKNFE